MPQSIHCNFVHIVFTTKQRRAFLDEAVRPKLWAFMAGLLHEKDCLKIVVGGVADHVHVACNLTKKHAASNVIMKLKRDSSKWIKTQDEKYSLFRWQDGYGLFSVSPAHWEATRNYVLNQEEHHRKESFQEEFRRILNKYGAEYDERYVWD